MARETITPAKAERWLRTVRTTPSKTKNIAYTLLMQSGKWRDGGRVVIDGGFLKVGRSAVHAIAKSGIEQEMWVQRISDPNSSHPELH